MNHHSWIEIQLAVLSFNELKKNQNIILDHRHDLRQLNSNKWIYLQVPKEFSLQNLVFSFKLMLNPWFPILFICHFSPFAFFTTWITFFYDRVTTKGEALPNLDKSCSVSLGIRLQAGALSAFIYGYRWFMFPNTLRQDFLTLMSWLHIFISPSCP